MDGHWNGYFEEFKYIFYLTYLANVRFLVLFIHKLVKCLRQITISFYSKLFYSSAITLSSSMCLSSLILWSFRLWLAWFAPIINWRSITFTTLLICLFSCLHSYSYYAWLVTNRRHHFYPRFYHKCSKWKTVDFSNFWFEKLLMFGMWFSKFERAFPSKFYLIEE